MSKLTIKYLNNQLVNYDITGLNVYIAEECLKIEYTEKRAKYIPLCNIKEIEIKGANKIKGE